MVALVQVAEGGMGTGASARVQHLEMAGKDCAGGRCVGREARKDGGGGNTFLSDKCQFLSQCFIRG